MPIPLAIPVALGAASMLAPAADKWVTSRRQDEEAKRLSKTKRPVMGIPSAMNEQETLARMAYNDKSLPGQNIMENKIEANSGFAIKAAAQAGNPTDVLTAIQGVQANQNDAYNNLGLAAAGRVDANRAKLDQVLGQKSDFQQKMWQVNEFDPYDADMKAASALKNASGLNQHGAIKDVAGAAGIVAGAMMPGGALNGGTSGMFSKSTGGDSTGISTGFSTTTMPAAGPVSGGAEKYAAIVDQYANMPGVQEYRAKYGDAATIEFLKQNGLITDNSLGK